MSKLKYKGTKSILILRRLLSYYIITRHPLFWILPSVLSSICMPLISCTYVDLHNDDAPRTAEVIELNSADNKYNGYMSTTLYDSRNYGDNYYQQSDLYRHKDYSNTNNVSPTDSEFLAYSIIKPQIYNTRHKREINNTLANDGLHARNIVLTYYYHSQLITLDLQINDNLLPDEHFLHYQDSRSTTDVVQNFTKTNINLCHYQGIMRNKPNSYAAISTCDNRINGMVYDGNVTYFIHSDGDSKRLNGDHQLIRYSDLLPKNASCGYNHSNMKNSEPFHAIEPNFNRMLRYKRSNDESNVIRGPYNSNKLSSYVELVMVVDNKAYKSFGENVKKVHQHCKDLANIINALYVPLNIFIALVGVVIWNESNEIEISPDADVTLRNFLIYRRTKLVLEHPNDNAQLLTKVKFEKGVVGKALKGPICTHEYSGSVAMEHSQIVGVVATTMAHELGHNFGMEHDSPDCKCQDEKCIMSASSTSTVPVHWSSCSIDQLNIAFSRGMNYCLRNKPAKLFDAPQCGNGFVEPGEQCDCGLPAYCTNTCCDPETCMLRNNASCATGKCCDLSACRPKIAGSICRTSQNECDLPEYCTGESEYCPANVFKRDTEECDSGKAYCFKGNCRSHTQQCRILWGPTGENSELCYMEMNMQGQRSGNCGFNRLNNTYIACEREHVHCGMLHCRHLNERLEFGMESAAVLSHSFINHNNRILACRTALVDLGLQSIDPGLVPSGAKCGNDKMCVDQKCLAIDYLRANGMGMACPQNCNGNGICNSRGNCHCNIGFSGSSCLMPGHGGSVDSGPATNPNSHEAFQRFMYIFFFAVIPCLVIFCSVMYYCRHHPFFKSGKLAQNIIKTTTNNKQTPKTIINANDSDTQSMSTLPLPKSTLNPTDDVNSTLFKSSTDSRDVAMGKGMFGKFKGFTLRPLDNANYPNNSFSGPNVAYVQPTPQENGMTTHRVAPLPPNVIHDIKSNTTLKHAPALPPPNPGSQAKPIISLPILENSTLNMAIKPTNASIDLPYIRPAPPTPALSNHSQTMMLSKPNLPQPLPADSKNNLRKDVTIKRFASFLKKEEKKPHKEKAYIDRDKLRNLEISAPIPVTALPLVESSNSDSETTLTSKEEEVKNLVKRAQSMRSPTRKPNLQTFGSMRQPTGIYRSKSSICSQNSVQTLTATTNSRPKSPPPRPPPLKKMGSTTSSGYQIPVATVTSQSEHTYDDCEFIEQADNESFDINSANFTNNEHDNIYDVIEDITPLDSSLKHCDLLQNIDSSVTSNSEVGLLNEIVFEIEKRNGGDSIHPASALVASLNIRSEEPVKNITENNPCANKNNQSNAQRYCLKSTIVNTPVARVAPTRAELTYTAPLSSFKPEIQIINNGKSNATKYKLPSFNDNQQECCSNKILPNQTKSFHKISMDTANKSLPFNSAITASKPAATIQKPRLLPTKPALVNFTPRKPPITPMVSTQSDATTTISKVASLTECFETSAMKSPIPLAKTKKIHKEF